MLHKRVISGLLFLPIFYLVAWKLPPVYFTGLVLAAVLVGLLEFYRMAQARGTNPNAVLGSAIGALVVLESYQPLLFGMGKVYLSAGLLLILIARLFSSKPVEGALEDVASTVLGVFYVALLFSFQVSIRMGMDGKQWLVFLYFIIWASDIGAYSIGIPFGKHRLYEKVSPKKSIEGLIGALIASAAMALLCRVWSAGHRHGRDRRRWRYAVGDRRPGGVSVQAFGRVKDSGNLIPGRRHS
jgi:phosphatidate cytidylyltransferase